MRVLIAPDCFGGTLSAIEAAQAIEAGWRAARPDDELVLLPLSDGGPGFVDVLSRALPGDLHTVTVEDPLARPVPASFLLHDGTAYVESAQACGLHLLHPSERNPTTTTTYGVGQLVRAAAEAGASRIVVGLGGSATNDGGAGLLAALGLRREDAAGARLDPGGLPLAHAARLVGRPTLQQVQLIAATDVDAPLLGPHGATRVFGPQKGASPEQVEQLEKALSHWADLLEAHLDVAVRDLPGAGAAGGTGSALFALGAGRRAGIDVVAEALGLPEVIGQVDLVVTGEGSFDFSSLRGKVVTGVAAAAAEEAVPCLVLAGQVSVGRREAAAAGVEATYALEELVGLDQALTAPAESLATLTSHVARQWSV